MLEPPQLQHFSFFACSDGLKFDQGTSVPTCPPSNSNSTNMTIELSRLGRGCAAANDREGKTDQMACSCSVSLAFSLSLSLPLLAVQLYAKKDKHFAASLGLCPPVHKALVLVAASKYPGKNTQNTHEPYFLRSPKRSYQPHFSPERPEMKCRLVKGTI